jgi:hypothetical protein
MVLMVGGTDSNGNALSIAELYNPATGVFIATGNLITGRDGHTAKLLNDGKVLIAGGQDINYNALSAAELYDPSVGTFTAAGNMNSARVGHTATLLTDGTVLLAGGSNGGNLLASADLYAPTTTAFTPTASLNTAREFHTATLLPNGTVLVAGGFGMGGFSYLTLNSAEIFESGGLTPVALASIALNPAAPTLSAGGSQRFTATGTFSDSSTEDLSSVIWTSSDNTVATLTDDNTNSGTAFGVATGSASVTACAGTVCGSTTLTVSPQQLSITSLSPTAGNVGDPVIIAGTAFGAAQGSGTVTFNGITATVGIWSSTSIATNVPPGAITGNVVVTVGAISSNGLPFTVTVPMISQITPNTGPIGILVTVSGNGFGVVQGSASINGTSKQVLTWTAT